MFLPESPANKSSNQEQDFSSSPPSLFYFPFSHVQVSKNSFFFSCISLLTEVNAVQIVDKKEANHNTHERELLSKKGNCCRWQFRSENEHKIKHDVFVIRKIRILYTAKNYISVRLSTVGLIDWGRFLHLPRAKLSLMLYKIILNIDLQIYVIFILNVRISIY